jgi:hypothetical protein
LTQDDTTQQALVFIVWLYTMAGLSSIPILFCLVVLIIEIFKWMQRVIFPTKKGEEHIDERK